MSGFFGSVIRCSEKMTSSADRVLPLWNSTPGRRRMSHTPASPFSGSTDSASTISIVLKSADGWASGSNSAEMRTMSVSAVAECASIESLAPPPVAPMRR